MSVYFEQYAITNDYSTNASWTLLSPVEQSIKSKIDSIGTPLKNWKIQIYRGVLTGYNEAFIISGEQRDQLVKADPKSAEIIRPILRGRDIQRYSYTYADLWLISTFPSQHYDIEQYPAVRDYLLSFGIERLEQTGILRIINGEKVKARKKTNNKWFETQDSISYWNDLTKQKIVWGEISDKPKFAIDINGDYTPEATTFMMSGENLKYLLCFLNSTLSEYFFAKIGTTTGVGTLRWKKYLIETLPVPHTDEKTIADLDALVDSLLLNPEKREFYINTINSKIYSIYSFSEEEISFIENMVQIGAH